MRTILTDRHAQAQIRTSPGCKRNFADFPKNDEIININRERVGLR